MEIHFQLSMEKFRTVASFQQSGKYCDVQIDVGKRRFSCHRIVLSAASPVFDAMFSGGMKESAEETAQVKNIEGVAPEQQADTFQLILHFVYNSDQFQITADSCANLMFAANFFQVHDDQYCMHNV